MAQTHEERNAAVLSRMNERSRIGRDIAPLPRRVGATLYKKCKKDLKLFLESYFPEAFPLPFSEDHLKVIKKIETVVLHGGLFVMAMPRGAGKSTILERAALWALLYGHRRFVVIISAESGLAIESLESIQSELENNDRLLDAFPEVCYPIRRLEGLNQRSAGQLYEGKRTQIALTAEEIVFPTLPGSVCSGGIVRVAGITGRIRGMKTTTADGKVIRPDLTLIDDPQTDESARSRTQCDQRELVIKKAVLGLAGPGKRIAGLAVVTVIQQGDLADHLLDKELHPQWQGERTQMVYSWPKNESLWAEYVEKRKQAFRDYDGRPEEVQRVCNEFYMLHRSEMDEGAEVAWNERMEEGDLSSIQHSYNIRADRGDPAFFSEYQNAPLPTIVVTEEQLVRDELSDRINNYDRRVIPVDCSYLTSFTDCHARILYWAVVAWQRDFTGYIVDYGTEPDQGRAPYFTAHNCRNTLSKAAPNAGEEGAIRAGLDRLAEYLLSKEWHRDDGAVLRIERALIDANWKSEVVYQFCRQSPLSPILLPSHGRYIGAASKPLGDYTRKPGDRVGLNWRIPVLQNQRATRHVVFDTNFWKSFIRSRLKTAKGDPGNLTIFGTDAKAHELFYDHLLSEYSIRTQGRGRDVDEFRTKADNVEPHWWDCVVGCAVAASICGVAIPEMSAGGGYRKRKRVQFGVKGPLPPVAGTSADGPPPQQTIPVSTPAVSTMAGTRRRVSYSDLQRKNIGR